MVIPNFLFGFLQSLLRSSFPHSHKPRKNTVVLVGNSLRTPIIFRPEMHRTYAQWQKEAPSLTTPFNIWRRAMFEISRHPGFETVRTKHNLNCKIPLSSSTGSYLLKGVVEAGNERQEQFGDWSLGKRIKEEFFFLPLFHLFWRLSSIFVWASMGLRRRKQLWHFVSFSFLGPSIPRMGPSGKTGSSYLGRVC